VSECVLSFPVKRSGEISRWSRGNHDPYCGNGGGQPRCRCALQ
jgi:hypothetical protein